MKSTHEQMQFTKKGKMTVDSHFQRSDEDHNGRKMKENSKVSGICKQSMYEEYEQKKAEIIIHLKFLMELLQENVRNQTHGWTMRNKVEWQKLHAKKEN